MQNSKINTKKKIYIAGPLFSEAELKFNKFIRDNLKQYFDVYLPQDDGGYMLDLIQNGMEPNQASKYVFDNDIEALKNCDYLLIILDGKIIDEGAAFELGVAYTLRKRCIGLQTDRHRILNNGLNPMLFNSIKKKFTSIKQLKKWAEIKHKKKFNIN